MMKLIVIAIFGLVGGTPMPQGKLNENDLCGKVHRSGFVLPNGCSQLEGSSGGSYVDPESCKAKCNANPRCTAWLSRKTEKNDTPWCWNYQNYGNRGGNGCHDASFSNSIERGTFAGLSGCNPNSKTNTKTNNFCDKVYNSGYNQTQGCQQLKGSMGGSPLEPRDCKAKCNANPRCKLWMTEKTKRFPDTPWCWNMGDYKEERCYVESFKDEVEPNIFSGLSCHDSCDKVYNSGSNRKGCQQLEGSMGGSPLEPMACKAKCNANPRCKVWMAEKTDLSGDTPWCWNLGDYKEEICFVESFKDEVEPNILSGLSC